MRLLPIATYTDKRRAKHGAPSPHAIVVWRRSEDGTRCDPWIRVTDLNGDDASHIIPIGTYMAGPSGMEECQNVASYLLDMLRKEDVPLADFDPSDREIEAINDARSRYREREDSNLRGRS